MHQVILHGVVLQVTNSAVFFCVDQGIVHALRDYQQKLIDGKVSIYVRRAGPNYQEGLRIMRELGNHFSICPQGV